MYDSKKLLIGLLKYQQSLEAHLNKLQSEYAQLQIYWKAFNEVSEGNYAEQFRAGWIKTDSRFKTYIVHSAKIKLFLNEHIAFLARLNGESPEIYTSSYTDSSIGGVSDSSEVIADEIKIEGKSKDLKNNLGEVTENKIFGTDKFYPSGKYQAHHVIPAAIANKSPLVKAAIERFGFNIDSAINGIYQQFQTQKVARDTKQREHKIRMN